MERERQTERDEGERFEAEGICMNLKVALDWGEAGMGFRARGQSRDRMCVLVEGSVCVERWLKGRGQGRQKEQSHPLLFLLMAELWFMTLTGGGGAGSGGW